MEDEEFDKLVASVHEGALLLKGDAKPSQVIVAENSDVKHIRAQKRLSQREFAALLGVSISTLSNWEHGRRMPRGPARILLMIMARHPEVVWDLVTLNRQK